MERLSFAQIQDVELSILERKSRVPLTVVDDPRGSKAVPSSYLPPAELQATWWGCCSHSRLTSRRW